MVDKGSCLGHRLVVSVSTQRNDFVHVILCIIVLFKYNFVNLLLLIDICINCNAIWRAIQHKVAISKEASNKINKISKNNN